MTVPGDINGNDLGETDLSERLDRVRANFPAEILATPTWCYWDKSPRQDGRPSKRPLSPATGREAKTNDASTFGTFDAACSAALHDPRAGGVGCLLAGQPWIGIDFDHVIDLETGEVNAEALALLERLSPTYIEVSPSGDGLHAFLEGQKPDDWRCQVKDAFGPGTTLEVYDGTDKRYFTVTGSVWTNEPIAAATESDIEALAAFMRRTKQKPAPAPVQPRQDYGRTVAEDYQHDLARARWGLLVVRILSADGGYQESFFRVLAALKGAFSGDGLELAHAWARLNPATYNGQEIDSKWGGIGGTNMNCLVGMFEDARPGWQSEYRAQHPAPMAHTIDYDTLGSSGAQDADNESAPWKPHEAVALFPAHLIKGDDLLSRVVRWGIASAIRPQPAMALGAAIAMFGAILGRRVESESGLRTNFYIVNVGGTASGKEGGRTMVKQLLAKANLGHLIGPREFKSDTSIQAALIEQASQVAMIDEFGHYLSQLTGARAPAHLRGIVKTLLEFFSSANSIVAGLGYANRKENPATPILEPNLCVLGTSVEANVFEALSSVNVDDGFLNRCLVFQADEALPAMRLRGIDRKPPAELVAEVVSLNDATRPRGDLADVTSNGSTKTGCRTLDYTDDAGQELDAIEAEQRDRMAAAGALKNLWGRYVEHVIKLALIRTVVTDPTAEHTSAADLRWARELVSWCIGRLALAARDRLADSQIEADTKKVLRIIREAGEAGITQWLLTRKTQWLDRRARSEIVATLMEGEQVDMIELKPDRPDGKGKPTNLYRFIGGES